MAIVQSWERRLVALAQDPPYVYRDTSDELIRQHHRRLTTFVGYPEQEIAAEEARRGLRFPQVYRAYLARMGVARGDLFRGSKIARLHDFDALRQNAQEMLAEIGKTLVLADDHLVFMGHQGYLYYAFAADGGFDSAVLRWSDGGDLGRRIAPGFAELVEEELGLAEDVHAGEHETGGYYLTVYAEGGERQHHPALAGGDHPLPRRPRPER